MESSTMFRIRAVCGLILLLSLQLVSSYPNFRQKIPNGDRIPSPCNASEIWQGVGHKNHLGGGERNPFGQAFAANGYMWTRDLCEADSDGDGWTNGEELGDPNCEWSEGDTPTVDMVLTHPGVCEPIDSELCMVKNQFTVCTKKFKCPAFDEPDIVQHVVKLTESPVPAVETTYMCQAIDLPSDKDYHVVGMTPHLDNQEIIHHIIVYGCNDAANLTDLATPRSCFMSRTDECSDLIGLWGVGSSGTCHHEDAGFRVGLTSFKRVIIELHWNNPELRNDYRDGSGVILHLTPNLRLYDAGVIVYGQAMLIIPPGRKSTVINGTCPSQCTEQYLDDSINIFAATNHMHFLGSGALAQLKRGDTGEVITLAEDETFEYNTPMVYSYEEPVVMNPGDELHLMCEFNSMARDRTTFQGEATNAEMCFAFLTYYPKKTWNTVRPCVAVGQIGSCQLNDPVVAGCDMRTFDPTNPNALKMFEEVNDRCIVGRCLDECREYTKELVKDPCFQPDMKYFFQRNIRNGVEGAATVVLMEFWYKADSCLVEIAAEEGCDSHGNWATQPPVIGGAPKNAIAPFVTVVALLMMAFF